MDIFYMLLCLSLLSFRSLQFFVTENIYVRLCINPFSFVQFIFGSIAWTVVFWHVQVTLGLYIEPVSFDSNIPIYLSQNSW